jgi:hypothetical protein
MSAREVITLNDLTTTTNATPTQAAGTLITLPAGGCSCIVTYTTVAQNASGNVCAGGILYLVIEITSGGLFQLEASSSPLGSYNTNSTKLVGDSSLTNAVLSYQNPANSQVAALITGVASTTLQWFTTAAYYIN